MKSIKMFLFVILFEMIAAPLVFGAEDDEKTSNREKPEAAGYYAGVQAASSFGACTFRSVSKGNFNPDFDGGVFFGYRFSTVFSLQLEAVAGQAIMKSLDCCDSYVLLYRERVGGDYILENDYFLKDRPSTLKDIPRWQYSDLKSYVNFQRFGIQGNINLIGIFKKDTRLSLDVSPEISGVRTKTRIKGYLLDYDDSLNKTAGEKRTGTSKSSWHLGYGAETALGWKLNDGNTIQLFGSTTFLNGKRIDAMPQSKNLSTDQFDHYENLFWEAGLKYIYRF